MGTARGTMVAVAVWDDEAVWPNFSHAAQVLNVDRSTLSKQARAGHITFVRRGLGRGERLVPPREVLRIAMLYRKVPMTEVRKRMAHITAKRTALSERALLVSIEQLQESVPDPSAREVERMGRGAASTKETAADVTVAPRVVDLRRLQPQRIRPEDIPSPSLVDALNSRRVREPKVQIVEEKPRVIPLGRLRPGTRT